MGAMRRALKSLLFLATLALGSALAQGSWVSLRGGLAAGGTAAYGFAGSLDLELEWLDPTLGVYPRGSVAYLFGVETLFSGPLLGVLFEGGGVLYSNNDRTGLFGAVRGGGGVLVQGGSGVFVTTLGLSAGYRLADGPLELGLEGGLRVTTTEYSDVTVLEFSPRVRLSAGVRF